MNNSEKTIKFFVSGQVDSGKSTLIGYLLHKIMDIRFDETSKEHTKYSDILDVEQSERERGITQYSSKNIFHYNGYEFQAIDTPGHLLYIRELINAISSNKGSIGCLIISAVLSEFNSMFNNGTTKEDTILMRCCGVNHVIILINKIDKNNAEPNKIKELFNIWIKQLGFKSISFVNISGYFGLNIIERYENNNPSFIETLIEVNKKIKRNIIKEKLYYKCKIVILNFHVFDINNIIAVGYKSIFHIVESKELNEIEGEILTIQKNNKFIPFFRKNENVIIKIMFDNVIEIFENQRFILRDSSKTIGFGYAIIK